MAALHSRRIVGTLSSLLLAVVTLAGFAGPAQAEDGYQYWNYFHLQNGTWAFSQVGVADYKPKDGAVEGFRYGTSTTAKGIEPRADLDKVDFDAVCGGTKASTGKKRVAVLLDFGTETGQGTPPQPRAECAVADESASTLKVLDSVTEVRSEKSMLCAIEGYPATGCGEPVKNAKAPAHEQTVSFAMPHNDAATSTKAASAPQQAEDGSSTGLWTALGVGLLVVLIAVGALVISRRSKRA